MNNRRFVENTNPNTGEVTQNLLFDTKLVSINRGWTGSTPSGKEFHLAVISLPIGNKTARIYKSVLDKVEAGEDVTVSAVKLDTITAFSVIGTANGGNTSASEFDQLIAGMEEVPAAVAPEFSSIED